ncbi:PASTA domain-containing protein [Saccharothrix deserti]|uniref:PASTA domain-containing protein n=1 Tax=Saccharothrix deserti TaxID=2593674 RepID=UPI001EE4522D|nr:PASTA domain-containing protein [Saccharothrix deserti]
MSQPKWVWVVGVVAAVVVVGALADGGDGGDGTAPPAATDTTQMIGDATYTTSVAPKPQTDVAKTCTVPDVVGMIHQSAQDTMQAAGLYRLREEDATGQGRVLVVDRNWTTTAQDVAAGQVVPCDTEITLLAKKTGE